MAVVLLDSGCSPSGSEGAGLLAESTALSALEQEAYQVGDYGSGMRHVLPSPIVLSQTPLPGSEQKSQSEAKYSPVAPLDHNEEVLERLRGMAKTDLVNVTVTLEDLQADWARFAALGDDDEGRSAFIDERRAKLAELQKPFISWLAAKCEGSPQGLWLVNQVQATVPAGIVPEILNRTGVRGISLSEETVSGLEWDGARSQDGTRMSQFFAAQLDGRAGNRVSSSNNIRVGIMEAAMLNRDHVGWRDWQNGPTRLVSVKDCGGTSCVSVANTGPGTAIDYHGTLVTWVAAGSIQQGQDSTYPGTNTVEQRRRSGHLAEADIYYYTGSGSDAIRRAIDQAVIDGVDVMNLSLQFQGACSSSWNVSGINEALSAATNAGVLINACGGNSGSSGCTVWYPGLRTETLAVNGLNTANEYMSLSYTDHPIRRQYHRTHGVFRMPSWRMGRWPQRIPRNNAPRFCVWHKR